MHNFWQILNLFKIFPSHPKMFPGTASGAGRFSQVWFFFSFLKMFSCFPSPYIWPESEYQSQVSSSLFPSQGPIKQGTKIVLKCKKESWEYKSPSDIRIKETILFTIPQWSWLFNQSVNQCDTLGQREHPPIL